MSTYTMAQIKNLWIQAGGSPTSATMAAAIALAESAGDPDAVNRNQDGSTDRGLWQINSVHGSQSTFDPIANARAAVAISQNGTSWRPWCTAWSTGLCSGTYLGQGAPVFKFLSGAGTPIDTVGVPTPALQTGSVLSPQTWADAFLRPFATWAWYGAMGVIGIVFIVDAVILLTLKSPVGKTLLSVTVGVVSRGAIKGKGGAGKAGGSGGQP